MDPIKLNIIGASGHCKVVIDILLSQDITIGDIYDDDVNIEEILGYKVLHHLDDKTLKDPVIIAIGKNSIRKSLAEKFKGNFTSAVLHSTSFVSHFAQIGEGTVVMANSSVNSNAIVGEHCIINTGATVEHDCIIEDFAHISPNAALAGGVSVGEGSHVGIGAVVIPGIKIGKWVIIGAGAVIIRDVPDYAVVVGNPGKEIKTNNKKYAK